MDPRRNVRLLLISKFSMDLCTALVWLGDAVLTRSLLHIGGFTKRRDGLRGARRLSRGVGKAVCTAGHTRRRFVWEVLFHRSVSHTMPSGEDVQIVQWIIFVLRNAWEH